MKFGIKVLPHVHAKPATPQHVCLQLPPQLPNTCDVCHTSPTHPLPPPASHRFLHAFRSYAFTGASTRFVLIFDIWHPDFSADEVRAFVCFGV